METCSIFVATIILIFCNPVEAYPRCLQSHEDEGRLTLKRLDVDGMCNSDCVFEKVHIYRYNNGYHYSYFHGRYCVKQVLGSSCTGGACQGYIYSVKNPALCFSASPIDDRVRLKSSGCTPFSIRDGKFFIGSSNRCLRVPSFMMVVDDCEEGNGTLLEFVEGDKVIKLTGTNLCIHPHGGQPRENKHLVRYGDCNPQTRIQYTYSPV